MEKFAFTFGVNTALDILMNEKMLKRKYHEQTAHFITDHTDPEDIEKTAKRLPELSEEEAKDFTHKVTLAMVATLISVKQDGAIRRKKEDDFMSFLSGGVEALRRLREDFEDVKVCNPVEVPRFCE